LNKARDVPPAVRRAIYERDHICRGCGRTGRHIHHVTHRSQGGDHDEQNLILLCGSCHDTAHAEHARWQPLLREVIRLHYEEGLWVTVPQAARRTSSG
jgi:5-methylcytosine-specific restriction endonuclease McrA